MIEDTIDYFHDGGPFIAHLTIREKGCTPEGYKFEVILTDPSDYERAMMLLIHVFSQHKISEVHKQGNEGQSESVKLKKFRSRSG